MTEGTYWADAIETRVEVAEYNEKEFKVRYLDFVDDSWGAYPKKYVKSHIEKGDWERVD